jgi:hypothetical protein
MAGSDAVVSGISDKLSRALIPVLAALGIETRLDVLAGGLTRTDRPFAGTLSNEGAPIAADLVIPTLDARPVFPPVADATASALGQTLGALATYKPSDKPFLLVPIGPRGGSSVLPLGRGGWVAGPAMTRRIKGRDLFLTSTRADLGYGKG